ncbi:uncharacterized protein [Choristoneura fumiferana]|uniref:uncharacterized protein n=1 Tax=Choristoneura fumiferana TaxID=7141 RepID=UPI003D15567B
MSRKWRPTPRASSSVSFSRRGRDPVEKTTAWRTKKLGLIGETATAWFFKAGPRTCRKYRYVQPTAWHTKRCGGLREGRRGPSSDWQQETTRAAHQEVRRTTKESGGDRAAHGSNKTNRVAFQEVRQTPGGARQQQNQPRGTPRGAADAGRRAAATKPTAGHSKRCGGQQRRAAEIGRRAATTKPTAGHSKRCGRRRAARGSNKTNRGALQEVRRTAKKSGGDRAARGSNKTNSGHSKRCGRRRAARGSKKKTNRGALQEVRRTAKKSGGDRAARGSNKTNRVALQEVRQTPGGARQNQDSEHPGERGRQL